MAFERLDYGQLMEFTDSMISALGETVYVTMDDNRCIGACHEMGAGCSLGLKVGVGQEKHSMICILRRYDIAHTNVIWKYIFSDDAMRYNCRWE
jgi:hypothetical protein